MYSIVFYSTLLYYSSLLYFILFQVKVTCALGSSSSQGIAVTCHSQSAGPDACYVLTAYQVESGRPRRYVLGVKEAGLREGPEQVQQ